MDAHRLCSDSKVNMVEYIWLMTNNKGWVHRKGSVAVTKVVIVEPLWKSTRREGHVDCKTDLNAFKAHNTHQGRSTPGWWLAPKEQCRTEHMKPNTCIEAIALRHHE